MTGYSNTVFDSLLAQWDTLVNLLLLQMAKMLLITEILRKRKFLENLAGLEDKSKVCSGAL